MGAGAIGSLFGGLLAKHNKIVLIGRTLHIQNIMQQGLHITGKTTRTIKIHAQETLQNLPFTPELILLTVKSYDTKKAAQQLKPILKKTHPYSPCKTDSITSKPSNK